MNSTLVLMKTICIRVKLHQQACKLSRKVTNISDFQKKVDDTENTLHNILQMHKCTYSQKYEF